MTTKHHNTIIETTILAQDLAHNLAQPIRESLTSEALESITTIAQSLEDILAHLIENPIADSEHHAFDSFRDKTLRDNADESYREFCNSY